MGLYSIILGSALTLVSWNLAAEEDRSEVLDRIKPVGTVAITGQPAPAETQAAAPAALVTEMPAAATTPAAAPAPGVAATGDGESVYKKACFVCHATGVAGSPKIGDQAAWGARTEKGIDALMVSTLNGTAKGMPPKGTCMTCSDAELKAAVEYMISQSK
ncbi:MAG: c-type cytochrome [Gammaproteobacteria bacterium]|nr:c-type cytochrome [Gammaproteobacteria bacterium]MBU1653651.1 c-type cytochrome [Gammaproteobacteria bacterium]MBU1962481.1 c-type cytochrome [Gammaproteobacteria bacterium]